MVQPGLCLCIYYLLYTPYITTSNIDNLFMFQPVVPNGALSLKLQATLKRIRESVTLNQKDEETKEYKVRLNTLTFLSLIHTSTQQLSCSLSLITGLKMIIYQAGSPNYV